MSVTSILFGLVPPGVIRTVSVNQWRHPMLRRVCKAGADLLRNTDGKIQHGVGKGLYFNAGRSHSGFLLGTHKPIVQDLFAAILRPGMTVYDIGANVGYYSVLAGKLVGATGRVISFEPVSENALQIERNARLNKFHQIKVRVEALADSDGTTTFMQSAEPTWGKLGSVGKPPDQFIGQIQVPVRRLDSIMEKENLPVPDLIKIDVEGAEVSVLDGARRLIESAKPILMIELHGTNAPIASALQSFGYEGLVLGHKTSIVESPWGALVLAIHKEQTSVIETLRPICLGAARLAE